MSTTTTTAPAQKLTVLTEPMRQRVEALKVARHVLTKEGGGPFTKGNLGEFGVVELVDVAEYVMCGTLPLARHDSTPSINTAREFSVP